mgnify:FL=1
MQIAIIKDNTVETMGEHKELFPNVGFPGGLPTDSWMSENSVMPLIRYHSYNILTEKLVDVSPYIESGVVYLTKVEALDDSEKAAAEKEKTDRSATASRAERNRRLEETDWMANSDVTMTDECKTYRKELRDITKHSNWPNLRISGPQGGEDDWPVKPS